MPEMGGIRFEVLLMVAAAALATWMTRFGGVWLVRRIPLGPRAQAALASLPGAILAALVAPAALHNVADAFATGLVIVLARRLPAVLAIAAGILAIITIRSIF